VHVVEAGQQQGDRGFARAGGADEGYRLARRQLEVETRQHGLAAGVTEHDRVEADGTVLRRQLYRIRLLDDHGIGGQEVQDALGSGPRLLPDYQHTGEHPRRAGHLQQVGGEGKEGADRDAMVEGQPATEGQDPHLAQDRKSGQDRLETSLQAHGAQPRSEKGPGPLDQPIQLPPLLPEPFHDPHPGDGLFHHHRHLPLLLLRVPVGGEGLAPHPIGRDQQGRHHRQRDEGQQRRVDEHDHQR
jgi:hypothetical protein